MKYTYPDIVSRLTNLERLAEPPLPGESGGCMSSYDRRSRYDPETDKYIDWDANDDGEGFIRREDDFIVAFEQTGPGCIWRVLTGYPGDGPIQIFIDDEEEPVFERPFRDFFEWFDSDYPPVNFNSLVFHLSRGRNWWIPITFNKYCKVRFGPGWGRYYHFTYTKFPADTEVPSFNGKFNQEARHALTKADRELYLRGHNLSPAAGDESTEVTVELEPGRTTTVSELLGNRAITGIRMKFEEPSSPPDLVLLRQLVLQIMWDHEQNPAVWCPLGDFFGSVPGVQQYRTYPQGVTEGGFYSRWFMPFSSRAEIAIHNDSSKALRLRVTLTHRKLERSADGLLRFHAKWHRDAFLDKARTEGRDIDWPLLMADNNPGPGRYVGVNMHVVNRWPSPTPQNWWWGEGDEKFFVDGEKFPSSFGTGTEDYIGFSWAADPPFSLFDSPFAAQPFVELDSNGHTCLNRFHIADDVPFQKNFEAYIEKYHENRWGDNNERESNYSVVAYWYQKAGMADRYNSVAGDDGISESEWVLL
jgi:hypothetical protein